MSVSPVSASAAGLTWVASAPEPVVVVESFIDARLAALTRERWPTVCAVVFIDTDQRVRVQRHAAADGLPQTESHRIIRSKDQRKRVYEQITSWGQIADHWIDNNGSITQFKTTLEEIMASTLLMARTRSPQ